MSNIFLEEAAKFKKTQTATTKNNIFLEEAAKFGGGGEPTTTYGQRAISNVKDILKSFWNPRIVIPGLYNWFNEPYTELYTTGIGKQLSETGGGLGALPASLLAALGAVPKAILEPPIKTTAEWALHPEEKAAQYVENPISAPLQDIMGAFIAGGAVKGIIGGAAKAAMTPLEIAIKEPGGRLISQMSRTGELTTKYLEPAKIGFFKPKALNILSKTKSGQQFIEFLGLTPEQQGLSSMAKNFSSNLRIALMKEKQSEFLRTLGKIPEEERLMFPGLAEGTIPTTQAQLENMRSVMLSGGAKPGQLSLLEKYGGVSKKIQKRAAALQVVTPSPEMSKALELWNNIEKEQMKYMKRTNAPVAGVKYAAKIVPEELAKQWGLEGKGVSIANWANPERAKWIPLEQFTGRSMEELEAAGIKPPIYYPHINIFEEPRAGVGSPYTGISAGRPGFTKLRKGGYPYEKDPYVAIPIHRRVFVRWQMTRGLIDDILDRFAKPIAKSGELENGYTKYNKRSIVPPGMTEEEIEKIGMPRIKENIQMPTSIVRELNSWVKQPSKVDAFLRSYVDPITNVWRVSVLALSPRWLLNNFVGNIILNTIGDVGISGYIEAFQKFFQADRIRKAEGISFDGALVKAGMPEGVISVMTTGEMAASAKTKLAAVLEKVGSPLMKGNIKIETFFRTAHYLDKIGKGLSAEEAVASVNKFLFDYTAMSMAERTWMRRIFPFWAWNKNITRLAFTYPFEHPMRAAILAKADIIGTDIYDDELRRRGIDPNAIPDYYKHMILLPWKDDNGIPFYISVRGVDPMGDVTSFITAPQSSLNPILKFGIEKVTGFNLFTQRQFTSPYDVAVDGRVIPKKPSTLRLIGKNFPQITMIDDLIHPYAKYDTGDFMLKKTGEPYYTKSKLQTILKILGINITPRDIEQIYESSATAQKRAQTSQENYMKKLDLFKQFYK